MFAVIRTGGKQYKVAPDDLIRVEKLAGEAGDTVEFADVLMIGGDGDPVVGEPLVEGATVKAELVAQDRGDKIIVFKKKRRKGYRRTKGHRQDVTILRITEIAAGGKVAKGKWVDAKKAKPKPAPAKQAADEADAAESKASQEPEQTAKADDTAAKASAKDTGRKASAAKGPRTQAKKPAAKGDDTE